ncbi:hypothetical protein G7Z17_g13064 [Cylindrodendrum hubeiense]|uniref:Class I SAM-dependent methyltransferase n=1 Tax=Cylindrodendrum hubeiense TaxID=595255 RepID=A0A9P5GXS5_9HYPO|nr:hypothetical protein G7Z17_g13064 [Cylindrodendrum hubeiense]
MAPWIPRMHLFEIDDQPWFPDFLRALVQDALTHVWKTRMPLQVLAPAHHAADVLIRQFGDTLSEYTIIDFCAGGGGPTPFIERNINGHLRSRGAAPVRFVLTDLHPNIHSWDKIARKNPLITYEREGVDASAAPEHLVHRDDGKKTLRLFNLAFHHFDDPLATAILRDTVETSQGFVIFELQDRSLASAMSNLILGIGVILAAPLYAWKWRSLATLIFCWLIPILPFVIVFDGYISSLRTRTPEEVEALLRSCGADTSEWEMSSGDERHLWPCGYLSWIVCKPVSRT